MRRQELVDAAVRVVRRKGLLQATSRDVAREAGTSVGLLTHYFATHDRLLVEAFEQVAEQDLERVRSALLAQPDAVGRLRSLLDQFSPESRAWQYRMWIDVWGAASHNAALQGSSRRLNEEWVALVTGLIREGVADGSFRCGDPDAAAWRLLALMDGMSVQLVAEQTSTPREVLLTWVRTAAAEETGVPVQRLAGTPPGAR